YSPTVNGNGNWWLHYGLSSAPTTVDTGTAPGTTGQQVVEVARVGGVLVVLIDGAQKATASPSPFSVDGVSHLINCDAETSGTTNCIVDYYKMWARTAR